MEYIKNALDNIEKTEFESEQFTDFNSQFQWFLGIAFALLFVDIFLLEKKTKWVKKMNLFNIEGKVAVITGGTGTLGGSIAAFAACMDAGVEIIRVHDVKETVQFKKVINAIKASS